MQVPGGEDEIEGKHGKQRNESGRRPTGNDAEEDNQGRDGTFLGADAHPLVHEHDAEKGSCEDPLEDTGLGEDANVARFAFANAAQEKALGVEVHGIRRRHAVVGALRLELVEGQHVVQAGDCETGKVEYQAHHREEAHDPEHALEEVRRRYLDGEYDEANARLMTETYGAPDPYAMSEMEDAAIAVALDRLGMLDRYIIIRDSVNMDVFMNGTNPEYLWAGIEDSLSSEDSVEAADIFAVAMENNYKVGSVVVDAILDGTL